MKNTTTHPRMESFTIAQIAGGFGKLLDPLQLRDDGWFDVTFAARTSAQAFADWAHAMGYVVRTVDVWTVRLAGKPGR